MTTEEKLRQRVQWLRRRERSLLGKINGPRFIYTGKGVFICHVGDLDGYINNDPDTVYIITVDANGKVTQTKKPKTVIDQVIYDTWQTRLQETTLNGDQEALTTETQIDAIKSDTRSILPSTDWQAQPKRGNGILSRLGLGRKAISHP